MTGKGSDRKLLSGSLWTVAGKGCALASAILVNALLARLLRPEVVGAYFTVLTLVSAAVLVGQGGMNLTAVKLVAGFMGVGREGRAREAVGRILSLGTVGALTAGGVLLITGNWLSLRVLRSPLVKDALPLAAPLVLAGVLQGLQAAAFRGFHDLRSAAVFGGGGSGALTVIALAALSLAPGRATLQQVLWAVLFSQFMNVGAAALTLRGRMAKLQRGERFRSREILSVSLPMLCASAISWLLTQSDLWIVACFRNSQEVALYGAASRLVLTVAVSLSVVNSVLPPMISEYHTQGRLQELEKTLRSAATVVWLPALAGLVAFFFSGPAVLAVVYGDFYRAAAPALAILAIGQGINVWSGSCGMTLIMTGHQLIVLAITMLSAAATILSALLLVRPYGIVGVAFSFSGGMLMQNVFMLLAVKRMTGIWTHARLAWPVSLPAVRP